MTLRFTFYILCVTLLAACSLAEDITPPPGIELTQTAAAPAPVFPNAAPNPANGEALYQLHCYKCHGVTGRGDGELAGQVNGQLPDFTDPRALRDRAPSDLFNTITQGRVQKTMPPFANALSLAERWDVVAYLYTFSAAANGAAVFTARCAECHVLSDFSSLTFFATTTDAHLLDALARQHTFTETLSEADGQAVAQYLRSLAYTPPAIVEAGTTPTPVAPAEGGVTVGGSVTNGSANAHVPAALTVQLYLFDQFTLIQTYTATVQAGQFEFAHIPAQSGQALMVVATHAGLQYTSDIARFDGTQSNFDLPLTLFETTTDASVIRVARLHLVFSPAATGRWQVGELLILSNSSDRVLIADAGQPAIEVPLPAGATNLQFQESGQSQAYQATPTGFGYFGAVRPGAAALEILFSFELPIAGAQDFTQALRYPIDALNVLVPPAGLQVRSAQLTGPQTQAIQGTAFLAYSGANVPAGQLTLTLTSSAALSTWVVPMVVGVVLVIGAIGLGWWWRMRRNRPTPAPETAPALEQRRAKLIDALAQLDEDFARGQLAERDYQQRRATLKAEAVRVTQQLHTSEGK